jgi:ribosome-associated protein
MINTEKLECELADLEKQEVAAVKAQIRGISVGASMEAYEEVLASQADQKQRVQRALKEAQELKALQSKSRDRKASLSEGQIVSRVLEAVAEVLDAPELTECEKRELLAHVVEAVYPEEVPELKATAYSVVLKPVTQGDLTVANVNKVSTAVQLRFDISNSSLPTEVQSRLVRLAGSKVTAEGVLILKAQTERTQERNREAAVVRLVELIRAAVPPPKVRRATKPSRASKERRLEGKRRQSAVERARSSRARADED